MKFGYFYTRGTVNGQLPDYGEGKFEESDLAVPGRHQIMRLIMASINKVIIVGNLGRDPEIRYMSNGDAIANIAVATSYKSKDRQTGEQKESTEWHRISFFGRLAEIVGQYLNKGSSIYVEGRLQTRRYTDKEGIERYATDIIAENMQMLGSGRWHSADEDETEGQPSRPTELQAPPAPRKRRKQKGAPAVTDQDSDVSRPNSTRSGAI